MRSSTQEPYASSAATLGTSAAKAHCALPSAA